jgi:hypothetical protein
LVTTPAPKDIAVATIILSAGSVWGKSGNLTWGAVNLSVAFLLLRGIENFQLGFTYSTLSLFIGIVAAGIFLAWNFTPRK